MARGTLVYHGRDVDILLAAGGSAAYVCLGRWACVAPAATPQRALPSPARVQVPHRFRVHGALTTVLFFLPSMTPFMAG